MALVNNAAAGRKSPEWLSPQWEKKKQLTAARVEEAVQALKGDGGVVSYAAIRERVHSLSGVWISANTINETISLIRSIWPIDVRQKSGACKNRCLRD